MIDLHTHTLLSDGVLLPSELVRRAEHNGYRAIAITDHADMSNIDFVIPRLVKACRVMNRHWKIKVVPGVELTHVPLEEIKRLVVYARGKGARVIVGHGETVTEPVLPGTNRAFIKARVNILAHPGRISLEDAKLAGKNNVYLEITARKGHRKTNKHVISMARRGGAKMVLNTDSHSPDDLLNEKKSQKILRTLSLTKKEILQMQCNAIKVINS